MSLSRILYLCLFFIAAWSGYYLLDKDQSTAIQVAPNFELPMFSGQSLDNVSYNQQGVRSYVITSQHLDYYANSGSTTFEYPVLKVFRDGTNQEWELTAKRGILTKDQVLILYDEVVANNLLPDSGFDRLTTTKLNIQLHSRDFWADSQVELVGPQFKTQGQAMTGNFSNHSAVLYNHVQGRYETLTP
ncbi:LPS export ABC transporter periplasmic protein LptC [Vibrio cincinnatiensis]|uniref:LPS export ABC transporter periplasmic protein LptC n=1 Tax=Vibrio cincinnatiensis TaxID=675 RepID=UPI001EE0F40D|nr:LPS export ABC transporter periplasmic protein LptC [Vibrio cincinnatiensis]MCG3732167.1 LPS export ABC transporter periplasmic protein LptC [Vibrio cincinnatiensis]MCG3739588.1 LPS export ABC transporter periplasmic protein LptC [Vibrio cincinnatiensis]